MSDLDLIVSSSGPSGGLAEVAKATERLNLKLTEALDKCLGPDGTDAFDKSCNTCKHFQRSAFSKAEHNAKVFGFPGHCAKLDRPAIGWPRGQYCGHENALCYENRRGAVDAAIQR